MPSSWPILRKSVQLLLCCVIECSFSFTFKSRRPHLFHLVPWRNEKEADSVLEMMRSSPQPPNESTFLAMLHAYASVPGNDLPHALERVRHVLRGARESGIALPPMRVFGALVPFCVAGYEPQSIHVCLCQLRFEHSACFKRNFAVHTDT